MKNVVVLLSLGVLAAASPAVVARTPPSNPKDASNACGNNVVSCCNDSSESNRSGLISAIVGPILANGCLGVGLNAINILSGITSTAGMCGDNQVKCCTGNKNTGVLVVDFSCTSL